MKLIKFLLLMLLSASLSSYAQRIDCDNFLILRSENFYPKIGDTHAKKLRESFSIFEDLIKTKKTKSFLRAADKHFTAFGHTKREMPAILTEINYQKVCIYDITVDEKRISSIFFNDAENTSKKQVLKISNKFRFMSLEQVNSTNRENPYLEGDVIKIPLAMIRDWPFIDGEINGLKGQWMFDTGNSKAFSMHSGKIHGVASKAVGSGFVASGQKYDVLEYPLIDQVKVGTKSHYALTKIKGNNFNFLEAITTTVLGQIGFDYFKGYDMKIDYLRSELTFYKQKKDIENWKNINRHKNYITSLPYFTRRLDNHPMIKIHHEGIDFLLTFDTGGGKGSFTLEDSYFQRLMSKGDIEKFTDEPGTLYNWYNIRIDKHLTVNLYGIDKEDFSPAHKPLQITEKNTITLDHSFLSQYITIWDTRNKVIHVLKKK